MSMTSSGYKIAVANCRILEWGEVRFAREARNKLRVTRYEYALGLGGLQPTARLRHGR